MKIFFNEASMGVLRDWAFPTLLFSGGVVSALGGQLVLATVFTVAALGCAYTFKWSAKDVPLLGLSKERRDSSLMPFLWFKRQKEPHETEPAHTAGKPRVIEMDGKIATRLPDGGVQVRITDEAWLSPKSTKSRLAKAKP